MPRRARGVVKPTSTRVEIASGIESTEALAIAKREADEQWVEDQISIGRTLSSIITLARKPPGENGQGGRNIGAPTVRLHVIAIHERWSKESEEQRPHLKEDAVRRIMTARMGALAKGNHSAVAKYEEMLMKIQGTAAPEKHLNFNVDVKQVAMKVVSALSEEEMDELVEEHDEQVRLAEIGRQLEAKH